MQVLHHPSGGAYRKRARARERRRENDKTMVAIGMRQQQHWMELPFPISSCTGQQPHARPPKRHKRMQHAMACMAGRCASGAGGRERTRGRARQGELGRVKVINHFSHWMPSLLRNRCAGHTHTGLHARTPPGVSCSWPFLPTQRVRTFNPPANQPTKPTERNQHNLVSGRACVQTTRPERTLCSRSQCM